MAPELFACNPDGTRCALTKAVDVWSLGAVAFCLRTGHSPFATTFDLAMFNSGKARFPTRPLMSSSGAFIDFVVSLLEKAPDDRPNISQTLEHEWILSETALPAKSGALSPSSPKCQWEAQASGTWNTILPSATSVSTSVDKSSSQETTRQASDDAVSWTPSPIETSTHPIGATSQNPASITFIRQDIENSYIPVSEMTPRRVNEALPDSLWFLQTKAKLWLELMEPAAFWTAGSNSKSSHNIITSVSKLTDHLSVDYFMAGSDNNDTDMKLPRVMVLCDEPTCNTESHGYSLGFHLAVLEDSNTLYAALCATAESGKDPHALLAVTVEDQLGRAFALEFNALTARNLPLIDMDIPFDCRFSDKEHIVFFPHPPRGVDTSEIKFVVERYHIRPLNQSIEVY